MAIHLIFCKKMWTWTFLLLISVSLVYCRSRRTSENALITGVRTKGLSCSVTSTPCIYSNQTSELILKLENLPNHKNISVALTTQKPNQSDMECAAELMMDPLAILFDGLPSNVESQVSVFLNYSQNDDQEYFFCLNANGHDVNSSWLHQGAGVKVRVQSFSTPVIFGFRAEGDSRITIGDDGAVEVPSNADIILRIFGLSFSAGTAIRLTEHGAARGDPCNFKSSKEYIVLPDELTSNSAKVMVSIPGESPDVKFFICTKALDESLGANVWIHQGEAAWMIVVPQGRLLPLWLQILLIIFLLTLSGLFSGLNLGLMALDRTELKIIQNTGTENEKKYAKIISPVRNLGNYLLCTLLLGNVLVNSSLTILLDNLTSGLIAVIGSTLGIVLFGEIIPQAICSRHGLVVGAHTVWITKFFMLVTFPLSFPISKLLDLVLGEEIGNVYNRDRLKELIRVTHEYHDLQKDEVNIISGALELSKKTVLDVMTKLDDVFMLPYDSVLDFQTMSHIMKQGYTRIPIYEENRSVIIGLLNIKDLAFVDPDDNTPLKNICQFYNHPINFVFEDTTLAVMLDEFKKGQSHMAFVQHINTESDGDPFYEIIGVVTLEDVIEEIIQSEIIDETDVLTDNRHKLKRKEAHLKDFSAFAQPAENQGVQISPQMALATFQYLSTAVEPFKPEHLSETVLRKLMKLDIFYQIKLQSKETASLPQTYIYQSGKASDCFVLILEGRATVTIGKESLVFECGPFTYFGIQALAQHSPQGELALPNGITSPNSMPIMHSTGSASPDLSSRGLSPPLFIPDYTVQAIHDVIYMCIKRSHYQAALKATLLERQQKQDPSGEDPFKYMDKFPSDSLEHLISTFRRTAPNSARSSARSFNDLPGLTSGLRSGSIVSPLAAPTNNSDHGENARNRALSQPENVNRIKDTEDGKMLNEKVEIVPVNNPEHGENARNRALSQPENVSRIKDDEKTEKETSECVNNIFSAKKTPDSEKSLSTSITIDDAGDTIASSPNNIGMQNDTAQLQNGQLTHTTKESEL